MLLADLVRRALLVAGVQQGLRTEVKIEELVVYPVKSCGGISVPRSRLSPTGLEHDRMWAVVNDQGIVQTQRQKRILATIRPRIDEGSDTLTLAAGDGPQLKLPLRGTASGTKGEVLTRSGIPMPAYCFPSSRQWLTPLLRGASGIRLDTGAETASDSSEYYELARFDPDAGVERRVADFIGGDHAAPEDVVAFPDLFPLLLTASESLAALNARIAGSPVSMDRFRPNIVVAGAPAFDEDRWALVRFDGPLGTTVLRCLENDPRCQIPSVDQATGLRDPRFEPTTTLRRFRRLRNTFGQHGDLADAGPMFGVYAAHGAQRSQLAVGDVLSVLETSDAGSLHAHWRRRGPTDAVST